MPSLSSPGIGSGLDVKSIVSQLVALERRPIDKALRDQKDTEAQLSSFGLLQSYTNNLRDAARKLSLPGTWTPLTATSSDSASVSASISGSPATGSYSLQATQLARAQNLASPAFASPASTFGAGTLTLQLGSWSSGPPVSFSAKSASTPVSVSVTAGDSLSTVRDRINNAGAGVRASIVNDGTGSRLVIRSEVTGAENAVKIVAAGDPSLEDLAYSPDELTPGNMTQTLSARDATATINGLPVSSPTNTLSGAVQGLTLTLSQVTTNAVEVTITQDSAAMRKSVDDFVKAYNDLNAYVLDQTRYDPEKKVAGKLQGDSATRSLQTQLRQALQAPSGATAGFSTLSSLGIQLQRNGSLLVNNSLFSTALGDPAALAAAFSAEAPGEANDGFGVRFTSLTNALTDADGLLQSRAEGLRSRIKRQQDKVSDLESRVARTEERLLRQYNTLDNNLGRLNGLGGYVSQQVTAWNNTKR